VIVAEDRPSRRSSALAEASREAPADSRDATTVAVVAVTLAALVLRYVLAFRSGVFAANDLDGAAYFGAAVQLVHGSIPYKDFAFVQPPAVLLIASPIAALSRLIGTGAAFDIVRLLMPGVGTACVYLAARRVRHRGPVAVLVTGGIFAAYLPSIFASRTLYLEPWMDLACLAGITLAFDAEGSLATSRRMGFAGVWFGVAVSVKLWALAPLAVLVVVTCLHKPCKERLQRLLGGAAAGLFAVVLPFVVAAPGGFFHDVIISQLDRFGGRVPLSLRMDEIFGVAAVGKPRSLSYAVIFVAVSACVALLVAAARAVQAKGRRPSPLAVYSVICLAVAFDVLLVPGEFTYHYADFVAPFAAVSFGLAAAALARRFATTPNTARLAAMGAAVVLGAYLVHDVPRLRAQLPAVSATAVAKVIPPGACVVTDYTAVTIAADRFVADAIGCPEIVDAFGFDLTLDDGKTPEVSNRPTAALVAAWQDAFRKAGWIVLSPSAQSRIPLTMRLRRYLERNFRLVDRQDPQIWERNGTGSTTLVGTAKHDALAVSRR
jgi:alpha-1,2-mannosyltransferase